MKKIIYGICGIGNGHLYRQLPLIDYLESLGHQILFFAYGKSLEYLNKKYANHSNIKVVEVWVPYYAGSSNPEGKIDFQKTMELNQSNQFHKNLAAFSVAQKFIGHPDLIISDYEPNSAQYGYAYNCPIVTLDQQSKYICDTFPPLLAGLSYQDEIMRLKMFFPLAKRIACSFFKVDKGNSEVIVIPPVIRKEMKGITNIPDNNEYVVYLSAQTGYQQSLDEIIKVLSNRSETFSIFMPEISKTNKIPPLNIQIYTQSTPIFEKKLQTCSGIISTAGHSLLSEAMYLGIPVYAMPLSIYEQQLNAQTISSNHFGIQAKNINANSLDEFISNRDLYIKNIASDKKVLFKRDGWLDLKEQIEVYLS